MKVEDEIQLTHGSKELIQQFDEQVNRFEVNQLVIVHVEGEREVETWERQGDKEQKACEIATQQTNDTEENPPPSTPYPHLHSGGRQSCSGGTICDNNDPHEDDRLAACVESTLPVVGM